ncbi:F-box/WD repeat-containing protein 4 isoform X2 [Ixodes scapularis]|uniref:F-box/WD repeat-containing protein 4 isoform X2 n=1 Tax=Ixodes scapularis TaxID=6945 RepID=UPI001AD69596|nr:F-box/WD repeat-containing protein 4 isoform X2 [Ixodes scapularis]
MWSPPTSMTGGSCSAPGMCSKQWTSAGSPSAGRRAATTKRCFCSTTPSFRARGREVDRLSHHVEVEYMPWLQLERDALWYSRGSAILRLVRLADGSVAEQPSLTLRGHSDDVGRFVCKGGLVVSGGNDGSLCIWTAAQGALLHCRWRCSSKAISCVDYTQNVVVTGSRDRTVKVWTLKSHVSSLGYSIPMWDRVCSVALSECLLITGSAGCNGIAPLQAYDLSTGTRVAVLGTDHRNGAGVLHVCTETPSELLSCGYDTFVRLWDLRCPRKCVCAWEDPHDSAVYCVASDHNVTVLSGTNRYGVVRLWDRRRTRPVKMYYVGRGNSPVYSLAFDPCYMYVALDRSLNLLSFTGPSWNPRASREI